MLLGFAVGHDDARVDGLVPLADVATGRSAAIGRMARAVAALFSAFDALRAPRSLANWCHDLQAAIFDLTAAEDADAAASRVALWPISTALAAVSVDDPTVERSVFVTALRARLDDDAAGRGFVSGSITVAELRPMRSLPFAFIAVAGTRRRFLSAA